MDRGWENTKNCFMNAVIEIYPTSSPCSKSASDSAFYPLLSVYFRQQPRESIPTGRLWFFRGPELDIRADKTAADFVPRPWLRPVKISDRSIFSLAHGKEQAAPSVQGATLHPSADSLSLRFISMLFVRAFIYAAGLRNPFTPVGDGLNVDEIESRGVNRKYLENLS